jgi:hypothetical protein
VNIKRRIRATLTATYCAVAGVAAMVLTHSSWEHIGAVGTVPAVVLFAGGIGFAMESLAAVLSDDDTQ